MSASVVHVCPNCGNNSFRAHETTVNAVLITGDGNKLFTIEEVDSGIDTNWIQCSGCKISIDAISSLVTEAYFHEHIATKEDGSL